MFVSAERSDTRKASKVSHTQPITGNSRKRRSAQKTRPARSGRTVGTTSVYNWNAVRFSFLSFFHSDFFFFACFFLKTDMSSSPHDCGCPGKDTGV